MKKLLVVVFILIASLCQAQTVLVSVKAQIANYDTYTKEYYYGPIKNGRIEFTFYKSVITVNDENQSVYRIKSDMTSEKTREYNQLVWVCQDEENRRCVVSLVKFLSDNSGKILVSYSDKVFIYHLN